MTFQATITVLHTASSFVKVLDIADISTVVRAAADFDVHPGRCSKRLG